MEPSPASTSSSKTVFSDLNDDCILEVFKHLDMVDWCSAADVSHRFRQNARRHFTLLDFKDDVLCIDADTIYLWTKTLIKERYARAILIENEPPNQKLLLVSKVLRNFEFLVRSVEIFIHMLRGPCPSEIQSTYEKHIFELISLHCTSSLVELTLYCCNISIRTENALRPLLLHLNKLSLRKCIYSRRFAQMLSIWSPEMRELLLIQDHHGNKTSYEMQVDVILRQSFPKLVLLSLEKINNVKNNDLEEFLKLNPQLKKIGLIGCKNLDSSYFKSLATYVPNIEGIQIDGLSKVNGTNLKYLSKFNCLHTLKLFHDYKQSDRPVAPDTFMLSVLNEIHASNVRLQHLHVVCLREFTSTEQLVDTIVKFKTLKDVWLVGVPSLEISHILRICKELDELSDLQLNGLKFIMTATDLLEIIKCAPKLQSLQYACSHSTTASVGLKRAKEVGGIDLDAYMKMVEFVGKRKEKIRLSIQHDDKFPHAANVTPRLTSKYNHLLILVAERLYTLSNIHLNRINRGLTTKQNRMTERWPEINLKTLH